MSIAILFLSIGILLLALLLLLFRWTADPVIVGLPDNSQEVDPVYAGVPQRELTDRLFGSDDWQFVLRQDSDRIKRMFFEQRRALALAWMEVVRRSTRALIERHRLLARSSSELDALVELRVAIHYSLFRIFWLFVALYIWLHGPMGLSSLIRRVDGLSQELREVIKRLVPGEFDADAKAAMSYLPK